MVVEQSAEEDEEEDAGDGEEVEHALYALSEVALYATPQEEVEAVVVVAVEVEVEEEAAEEVEDQDQLLRTTLIRS